MTNITPLLLYLRGNTHTYILYTYIKHNIYFIFLLCAVICLATTCLLHTVCRNCKNMAECFSFINRTSKLMILNTPIKDRYNNKKHEANLNNIQRFSHWRTQNTLHRNYEHPPVTVLKEATIPYSENQTKCLYIISVPSMTECRA
jgi:hypothetical protein